MTKEKPMSLEIDDAQRAHEIVRKFKQRRRREYGTVLLLIASILPSYVGANHPEVRIAGLSGKGLLLAAAVLMVVSLGYHLANWRCPACHHYLRGGYRIAFCQCCEALFQGSGGFADLEMNLEYLFQEEVKKYRGQYAAVHLPGGIVLLGGTLVLFLIPQTAEDLRFIGFLGLAGLAWTAYAVYGMTYGARRFAARLREHLDS
jgi:hypothetical protein